MATPTICSSPTIPLLKSHQQNQSLSHFSPQTPASYSSGKFTSFNDAVTMAAAVEALTLARAAARAAREALEFVYFDRKESRRRKRRRRRRKRLFDYSEEEAEEEEEETFVGEETEAFESAFLSSKEEAELCLCLKKGAMLEKRVTGAQSYDDKLNQLVRVGRIKRRSIDNVLCRKREACERITRSYKGLVVSIAIASQGKGLSLQDLVQEGSIGLLQGAEKFDPQRGFKLSTYVYWWIKQAIIKALAKKSRLLRLPGSMCEMVGKVARANSILNSKLKRTPTFDEIAKELNVNVSTVRLTFNTTRSPVSLDRDRAATDQGHMNLQEIISGPDETRPEYMVKRWQIKQEIEKLIETLSERESRVVRLYFGLNGETPKTCEEIGWLLKLSRERIRQINNIALIKLRQIDKAGDLNVFIV